MGAGVAAATIDPFGQLLPEIIEGRRLIERRRLRTIPGKYPGRAPIAARAGVIGKVGEDRSIPSVISGDGDHDAIVDRDGVGRDDHAAFTVQGDVGDKIDPAIAARSVKFEERVTRDAAAADR